VALFRANDVAEMRVARWYRHRMRVRYVGLLQLEGGLLSVCVCVCVCVCVGGWGGRASQRSVVVVMVVELTVAVAVVAADVVIMMTVAVVIVAALGRDGKCVCGRDHNGKRSPATSARLACRTYISLALFA
jgi:hypothetical protein